MCQRSIENGKLTVPVLSGPDSHKPTPDRTEITCCTKSTCVDTDTLVSSAVSAFRSRPVTAAITASIVPPMIGIFDNAVNSASISDCTKFRAP